MKLPSSSARCEHRPPAKYETLNDLFAQAKHYNECQQNPNATLINREKPD
jgi:hypothetical protein